MPLVEVPIPHLLSGVSQQPPAARLPGQLTASDNAIAHAVNGLGKRRGTRHLARLLEGRESVLTTHLINRDPSERYQVLIGERRVRVFHADTGAEYPVKVNGTATDVGRGAAGTGTPLAYLDPRRPGGEVDQDEDFVIGVGDWQSVAGNSATTYTSGRGPFGFGRRESLVTVNSDTVARVGNAAAALVSDIFLDAGTFSEFNVFAVFVKADTANDVELSFDNTFGTSRVTARFGIAAGVITLGTTTTTGQPVTASAEAHAGGWYRCEIRAGAVPGFPAPGFFSQGGTRRIQIRFHTNAATPANKTVLLFGARCYSGDILFGEPTPTYIFDRSDLVRALTVADSTFLLNTEKITAMTAADSSDNPTRAFFWVKQGGIPDVDYVVKVYYTTATVALNATFTFTSGAGPGSLGTDADIAEGLRALIDANADLVATRVGSVVQIAHVSAAAGNAIRAIEVSDSRGDTTMAPISQDVDGFSFVTKFTDLPRNFRDGHVVRVSGDPERDADDYYVRFSADEVGTFGAGAWEEGARPGVSNTQPGLLLRFDNTLMPQLLTRRQDNSTGTITGTPFAVYFDVSPITWDDRLVGDESSNEEPSFIGHAIQDLFLYRGRLGFLAVDSVILSEAGEVFNLWRTTVLEVPDTDPIDIDSGTRDVVLFRNAVPTSDRCLLFSDRHQFELLGDPTLTPASAQLAPIRTFENLPQVKPVDTGRGAIFARRVGAFTGLMEASLVGDASTFRIEDLTVQAPRYYSGSGLALAHSSLTGVTLLRVDSTLSQLGVHQTFHDDQENRLQSAVHRWILDPSASVLGLGFLDDDLRLVVEREEGLFLEALKTSPELLEEDGEIIVHLDRRTEPVSATYSGGPDETELELPYEIAGTATMQVVDRASGLLVPVIGETATSLIVSGDLSAGDLYIGERYDMVVTLSEPVIQDQGPRGGIVPRMGRPLDVHLLHLYLASTAFLKVRVERDLRSPTDEEFSAAGLGTGLLLEGSLNVYTGDASFAVLGRSTEVDVTLLNETPFPSYIQSGRFEVLNRARAGLA